MDQLVAVSLFPITFDFELSLLIRMDGQQVWQLLNSYGGVIASGYCLKQFPLCTLFWLQLSIAGELGMHNSSVQAALANLN